MGMRFRRGKRDVEKAGPEAPVTMRPPRFLHPLHEVTDTEKRDALAASMRERGWDGPPLVADSAEQGRLLTGSHRVSAAREAGLDDVPVVEIGDVFTEGGADFAAKHAEYGEPAFEEYDYSRLVAEETPPAMKDKYGIDVEA